MPLFLRSRFVRSHSSLLVLPAGTNWSPAAAKLAADGARDFPWLEGAYLSQKLGVGAIVETVDGFLLSLRRSSGVGEGQGMMDAPGGHPEPTVRVTLFLACSQNVPNQRV